MHLNLLGNWLALSALAFNLKFEKKIRLYIWSIWLHGKYYVIKFVKYDIFLLMSFFLKSKLKYKVINSLSMKCMMNTLGSQIKSIFSDLISLWAGPWNKIYLNFRKCACNSCIIVSITINIASININMISVIA